MRMHSTRLSALLGVCVLVVLFALSPGSAAAQCSGSLCVTSATPNNAPQGTTTLNVTVGGSGFNKGAHAAWHVSGTTDTGGVVVNSTTFNSSTQLVANITIPSTATVSGYDVTVYSSGRTGVGSDLFTVSASTSNSSYNAAELTIVSGHSVVSDGVGQISNNLYADWEIKPSSDPCVSGTVNSTGFTVFYLDRQLSDGTFCNANPAVLGSNPARSYLLVFPYSSSANSPCQVLGVPEDILNGSATGYCTVHPYLNGYSRILLSGLFGTRASTTSARFAFDYAPGGGSTTNRYSVIPSANAGISVSSSTNHTAVYNGKAALWLVTSGGATQQLASNFNFSFVLQVQQVQ